MRPLRPRLSDMPIGIPEQFPFSADSKQSKLTKSNHVFELTIGPTLAFHIFRSLRCTKTNSWNLKIPPFERKKYRPQPPIFGFHANFLGVVKIHANPFGTPTGIGAPPPSTQRIGSQVSRTPTAAGKRDEPTGRDVFLYLRTS